MGWPGWGAVVGHGAHYFFAEYLGVIDQINAVAFAFAHFATAVEAGHFHGCATEIEVGGFGEDVGAIE